MPGGAPEAVPQSARGLLEGGKRGFAAGAHGKSVTYEGLTLHEPSTAHKVVAHAMSSIMWFWIFYRFYKDGGTLLYGHAAHFEHEDGEEADDEHH